MFQIIQKKKKKKYCIFFYSYQLVEPHQIKGSIQSLNLDALINHTFVPDYSVRAITDVCYIAFKRTLYLAAKRATLMERSQKYGEPGNNDPIDDEVEKLLHSMDEDDRSINAHTANLNVETPRASKTASPTMITLVCCKNETYIR